MLIIFPARGQSLILVMRWWTVVNTAYLYIFVKSKTYIAIPIVNAFCLFCLSYLCLCNCYLIRSMAWTTREGSGVWTAVPRLTGSWWRGRLTLGESWQVVCKNRRPSLSHNVWRLFLHMYNFLRILRRGLNESSRREDSKTPLKMYENLSET